MASETESAINKLRKGCSIEKMLEEVNLPELSKYLMAAVYKKNISMESLADLAGLSKSTVYRICDDKMHPSANVLIRLSRVLEMGIEDTQRLLKCGNQTTLSGERPRDLIIMSGIIKNKCIADINDDLTALSYPDLLTSR